MPKISYIDKRFNPEHSAIIATCNGVIGRYAAQGFNLTLRQLYYQMIAGDLFPSTWIDQVLGTKNTEKNYKRFGGIVNDARLAGEIDWNAIEDRGRNLRQNSHWATPADIIRSARQSFAIDKWANQPYRPEVWVEKQALEGIVGQVCEGLDVPYFACKGYNSQSEQWRAGQRMMRHADAGQTPIIFHLGDHDPSGIDMTRDNADRLSMFIGDRIDLQRIALNMEQINELNPPPSPAKESDSRGRGYIAKFGDNSWELDALDPQALSSIIENAILSIRDDDRWYEMVAIEDEHIRKLAELEQNWEKVSRGL